MTKTHNTLGIPEDGFPLGTEVEQHLGHLSLKACA